MIFNTKKFKYTVAIPEHRYRERYRYEWCAENLSEYGIDRNYTVGYDSNMGSDGTYYHFKDEADAVMFKLLFG